MESLGDKENNLLTLMKKDKFIKELMENLMEQKGREHCLTDPGFGARS